MGKEIVGSMEFLDTIVNDATTLGDQIIAEAKSTIQKKLLAADMEIKTIQAEYEQKLESEINAIKHSLENELKMEQRRTELAASDLLIENSINLALSKLQDLSTKPQYENVISNLIKEAVYGIGKTVLFLQISKYEKALVTKEFLQKIEAELKAECGADISITLEEQLNLKQGVVLKDETRRIIFDNQFETRLIRYQSKIRQVIQMQQVG